ncbi:MAG: helix-turn-helix domain-containing protein [Acidimicrobiales bacterium]
MAAPAELVRAVRRQQGLSQSELAQRAGTPQPVISSYARRRRGHFCSALLRYCCCKSAETFPWASISS